MNYNTFLFVALTNKLMLLPKFWYNLYALDFEPLNQINLDLEQLH